MDIIEFYRTYHLKRQNEARWTAKKQADDTWRVHFRADFVPSTNWTAPNYMTVIVMMAVEMDNWMAAVRNRFEKE
jgi:hypothetical protein